jgi:hypothetical protein
MEKAYPPESVGADWLPELKPRACGKPNVKMEKNYPLVCVGAELTGWLPKLKPRVCGSRTFGMEKAFPLTSVEADWLPEIKPQEVGRKLRQSFMSKLWVVVVVVYNGADGVGA